MTKVAVFIDGGHLRACAKAARQGFTADLIVKVAKATVQAGEDLFRIQYYDCEPYHGTVQLPVSGGNKVYQANSPLLSDLARKE